MKLDRNVNGTGHGKYGLVNDRRLKQIEAWDGGDGEVADRQAVLDAVALLERAGVIDWGLPHTASEFFVIKLRDRFAQVALYEYANVAGKEDPEYGMEVDALAERSGPDSPFCKMPD